MRVRDYLRGLETAIEEKDERIAELEHELELLKRPHEVFLTVAACAKKYGFKESALRNWIDCEDTNGLAEKGAVFAPHGRGRGKTIYLSEPLIEEWLTETRKAG